MGMWYITQEQCILLCEQNIYIVNSLPSFSFLPFLSSLPASLPS